MFGGTAVNGIDAALHVFSVSRGEWFAPLVSGTAPSSRTQHTATLIAPHTMLVFGGCNAQVRSAPVALYTH